MKKTICLVITITLIIGSISSVSADTWSTYFGLNKGWYEGTGGSLTSNSATGWTANIRSIGWGGCWGGQVYQKGFSIKKGKKYTIKFSIKSSKLDKWIYLKIGAAGSGKTNLGKWIDCRKGKTINVKESFKAKYNGNSVYFGIGGDFHDRQNVKTDEDAKERYKYAPNSKLDGRLSSDAAADHPTVITCSGFSFNNKSPKLSHSILILEKGDLAVLKMVNAKGKVKWTASNKKIIKIKKITKKIIAIKAKKTGNTTIIAKYKKKKYKCRIAIF